MCGARAPPRPFGLPGGVGDPRPPGRAHPARGEAGRVPGAGRDLGPQELDGGGAPGCRRVVEQHWAREGAGVGVPGHRLESELGSGCFTSPMLMSGVAAIHGGRHPRDPGRRHPRDGSSPRPRSRPSAPAGRPRVPRSEPTSHYGRPASSSPGTGLSLRAPPGAPGQTPAAPDPGAGRDPRDPCCRRALHLLHVQRGTLDLLQGRLDATRKLRGDAPGRCPGGPGRRAPGWRASCAGPGRGEAGLAAVELNALVGDLAVRLGKLTGDRVGLLYAPSSEPLLLGRGGASRPGTGGAREERPGRLRPGDRVRVAVQRGESPGGAPWSASWSRTGASGIAAADLPWIFEPWFTTRGRGPTGWGYPWCRRWWRDTADGST
jgi:hypothetical protein